MGEWLTCVGNSREWGKKAIGNFMGGVKKK